MIRIGIDASNIISGGGLTHLIELINAIDLAEMGIKSVTVWSNEKTLSHIHPKHGVELRSHSKLEGNLVNRFLWQTYTLTKIAEKEYDILYVPGGSYLGGFRPFVTMNRNLQPFDDQTLNRYQLSLQKLRLLTLQKIQKHSYKKADGVIFLSDEAKKITIQKIKQSLKNTVTIPHGIAPKFFQEPREQQDIQSYSLESPFHFLYASTINVYKHQWNVVEAVYNLRKEGYPVVLDLIGSMANDQSQKLFLESVTKFDPENKFVNYHGKKNQDELLDYFHKSDACIFASSCETFGQILLESMASGLPIACADRSAMPEILKKNGVYFNPEDSDSITDSLRKLLDSSELRQRLSQSAYEEAKLYSWKKCARNTFNYISEVYQSHN